MATKNSDGSGEEPIISEEEWAEFERSFTKESTKTAAYKEPSARQRELTEKWKRERPQDTGWRTDGPRADLIARAAGGTGPGASAPGRRRRPWLRNLIWVVVAILVTVAIVGGAQLLSSGKNSHSSPRTGVAPRSEGSQPDAPFDGTTPGVVPSASATAGAAQAASPTYAHPDDQYFDGSPSIGWQNGAEGIVVPAAVRVGDYSAKTVGDAYAALRQMLITVDLDPAVLAGGEPTAAFKLLDPREGVARDYENRVAKPGGGAGDDPKAFATRFNPGTTKLLGKTVKVHGSMSAAVDKDGNLIVTGDYSFVYALSPAGARGLDRSLVRRVWKLDIQPTSAGRGTGYWLSDWWYDIANDRCDVKDGFINPSFGGDGGVNTGKLVDPYATTPPPDQTGAPSGAPSASASSTECDGVKPI
ncbi:MAG: hypothetical protein HOW97_42720 [Catenulispora sp.]|nr:hypothetical protein [Catenulispora sp.]